MHTYIYIPAHTPVVSTQVAQRTTKGTDQGTWLLPGSTEALKDILMRK